MIVSISTAFGPMLGIVKPVDAMWQIGAILDTTFVLMSIRTVLVTAW